MKLVAFIFFSLHFSLNIFAKTYIIKFNNEKNKQTFQNLFSAKEHKNLIEINEPDYVVQLNSAIKKGDITLLNNINLVEPLRNYLLVTFLDSTNISSYVKIFSNEGIEFVEENIVFTLDQAKLQDNLKEMQWHLNDVKIFDAWKKATGKGIRIGVVDTGIDFRHEDLKSQIWINPLEDINRNGTFEPWPDTLVYNSLKGDLNGIDDDANGYIDDVIGYDFVNQTFGNFGDFSQIDPIPLDALGHGTSVAGVIASSRNDMGTVGVAPDAKIVVLRAFDLSGNGELKDIVSAIIYAALNRVNLLNFSFGSQQNSRFLHDAIKFANSMGCIMVASSGNDGTIIDHYPSDFPEVLSVGASTRNGNIGRSSNFGPKVDIFAPGYEIFTTSPNNSYNSVSGTSLSAPIITGIAALLLELEPTLNLDDLRSILKSTQRKFIREKKSFDQGIVNAFDAVHFIGSSIFKIIYPPDGSELNKTIHKKISSKFKIYSPFFSKYNLRLFRNDTTLIQNIIENRSVQFQIDSVGIDISNLENGIYSLNLSVELTNGNFVNIHSKFTIYDDETSLEIIKKNVIPTVFENKSIPIPILETNLPCYCNITIYKNGKPLEKLSNEFYSKSHFIPIWNHSNILREPENTHLLIECFTKSGLTTLDTLEITKLPFIEFNPFKTKFKPLPRSYLCPKPLISDNINKRGILLNPYKTQDKGLDWGSLSFFSFRDGNFYQEQIYHSPLIALDVGDSNGDGIQEILTTSFGSTTLFQPERYSIYANVLFQSKPTEELWASQFYDLNSDGKDEIICFDSKTIKIYENLEATYIVKNKITPEDTFGLVGTKPNLQIGDFDGDNNLELAFFTTKGYFLVYQYNKTSNNFELEFNFKIVGDQFSISSTKGKMKNPTKMHFFFIVARYPIKDENNSEYSQIWTLYETSSPEPNNYQISELVSFWGVRTGATPEGTFYRNGIVSGNIDSDENDELLVSLFPNFYVFKYDPIYQNMKITFWQPFVYTNSAIVYDFDTNGIKEFGISFWDGLKFFELDTSWKLKSPAYLDGWVDNEHKIFLVWSTVENANAYEIYEYFPATKDYIYLTTTSYNYLEFDKGTGIREFIVRAVDTLNKFNPSDFTDAIRIFTDLRTYPIEIKVKSNYQLKVIFSGKLPETFRNHEFIAITNTTQNRYLQVSSINKLNDSSLLVTISENLVEGEYILKVGKFRDFYRNFSIEKELAFKFQTTMQPDSHLLFKKVTFVNRYEIEIEFPEDLDIPSATRLENYTIVPFGKIDEVSLSSQNKIYLRLSSSPNIFSLGKDFFLILKNIYNKDSSKVTQPPYNTIALTREVEEIFDAFVYPNPFELKKSQELYFSNIPKYALIEIFDTEFRKILELTNESWKGGVQLSPNFLNYLNYSGIYYFRVSKQIGTVWVTSTLKKFVVIR
ncbi:MAG: S8 family serine peptidase [Ignavibacteria bacterium]|nr:S8 family serine peptidase [Ignavibacteria bacterium]